MPDFQDTQTFVLPDAPKAQPPSAPMKIAMLTSVNVEQALGGAERTVALLAQQLVQRGHTVSVLTLGPRGSVLTQRRSAQGVDVWAVPLVQFYDPYHDPYHAQRPVPRWRKALWHAWDVHNATMARQVDAVLAQIAPQVVVTHALQGFSTAVWQPVRQRGMALVHMTHDHALICPTTTMTRGTQVCAGVCTQCAVYGALRKALCVQPDALVAPSQMILQRHTALGWFPQVPIKTVIPNALPTDWPEAQDLALGTPIAASLSSTLEASDAATHAASSVPPTPLTTPQRPVVFGFLGRMDESKGIDTLLQALPLLNQALRAHALENPRTNTLPTEPSAAYRLLVGGGGDAAMVRARWVLPAIEQRVELLGRVQAAEFLQRIDVLVVPSRAPETFCNVVMEAASLGRPSIVSERGALPERVQRGRSGWIVPADSPQALAQALLLCITQPAQVRDKARQALATRPRYSAALQSERFEVLLATVLARQAKAQATAASATSATSAAQATAPTPTPATPLVAQQETPEVTHQVTPQMTQPVTAPAKGHVRVHD